MFRVEVMCTDIHLGIAIKLSLGVCHVDKSIIIHC
nr:MAG TPA: hypothetical protein [Caudoviricetes sp.]